jgi:hypothetical protein
VCTPTKLKLRERTKFPRSSPYACISDDSVDHNEISDILR